MRSPTEILENLNKQAIKHKDNADYKFNELYKHLLNPLMYKHAYAQIYANKGSGTAGVDGQTADGFGEDTIQKITESMKDEKYQPQPTKRKYIPKKTDKSKKRPLGIPTMTDRYIQEIMNEMLTIIYEPLFSDKSFGFRQGLSCHDAISKVLTTFQGTVWFIEGDIKGFFDNIDHHIMIEILKKKISDERFIRLIWKFLRAGYLEEWIFHKTYSGTPQGGIISPILANIYLNEFDKYIEQLQKTFNKGRSQDIPRNPEYTRRERALRKISDRLRALKETEQGNKTKEYKELIKEHKRIKLEPTKRQQYKSVHHFKKLCYVRYADDFILGVIGSKEDAENIKYDIGVFLINSLELELSQEKTLITHSSHKAQFLSYEISVHQKGIIQKVKIPRKVSKESKITGKGNIRLTMSSSIAPAKLKELKVIEDLNARPWRAKRNTRIINNSELEIVEIYNEQIRGLYNYFKMADNVSNELNNFYYVMKWSMFHTFANKYKGKISEMLKKYRIGNTDEFGVAYYTKEGEKIRKFYHEGFKRNQYVERSKINVDYIPNMYKFMGRNELEKRILANKCEYCGKETKCQVHHVNAMKNIENKKNPLYVFMSARNRKTINLCPECHVKQRNGTL